MVEKVLSLKKKNGNKWMKVVKVAFMIMPNGERASIGYQFVKYHIFDIKKKNSRTKVRLAAGGQPDQASCNNHLYKCIVNRNCMNLPNDCYF